ncbi:NADH-quinone oxidoreductase subunit NuoB [Candidatus Bathyarchaeota archaeon]|nr:NADH-quinone oxidoreductase subunit NuoB [Candidatus Bathyarchaeota archaeon]
MGLINWARKKSPWITHAHCGGCNGCDIEIAAALTPRFDIERLGCLLKNNPRYSDVLIITGPVPKHTEPMLLRIYQQTPDPKIVMAIGECAIAGGIYVEEGYDNYSIARTDNAWGADKVVPVDVYVPGCPPKPEAIIYGLSIALKKLAEKKLKAEAANTR